jgi:hypothetical protein
MSVLPTHTAHLLTLCSLLVLLALLALTITIGQPRVAMATSASPTSAPAASAPPPPASATWASCSRPMARCAPTPALAAA